MKFDYRGLLTQQSKERAAAVRTALEQSDWCVGWAAEYLGVTKGYLHGLLIRSRDKEIQEIRKMYRRTAPRRGRKPLLVKP